MKEVTLPSGAILTVNEAPFEDAKSLHQVFLKEFSNVDMGSGVELGSMLKNAFCLIASSREFERALQKCVDRCLYNGEKITNEVFEPSEARADYTEVVYHVAFENLNPFMKGLFSRYSEVIKKMTESQQ